jgi:HD superfamily phosphohydrolase YqeK
MLASYHGVLFDGTNKLNVLYVSDRIEQVRKPHVKSVKLAIN